MAVLAAGGKALPMAQLKSNPFNERYMDNVPVSGMVLLGVGPIGVRSKDAFAIYLPPNTKADSVCVQMLTRDGRYWSKNEYVLSSEQTQGGYVQLDYQGNYKGTILQQDEKDLAALAYLGSCQSPVDYKNILVAGVVTNNPSQADRYLALINSGRSDVSIRVKTQDGRSTIVRCNRIEEGKRTGFDTSCELDGLGDGDVELQIARRQFDRVMPPVSFKLRLAK